MRRAVATAAVAGSVMEQKGLQLLPAVGTLFCKLGTQQPTEAPWTSAVDPIRAIPMEASKPAGTHVVAPSEVVPLLRRVGLASKCTVRYARRLLAKGEVWVDGQRCVDEAAVVGANNQVFMLHRDRCGGLLQVDAPHPQEFYLKLFKPRGVICSHRHEKLSARPIISSLYPQSTEGVLHPCGRLDRDSEGLLLLTSDGAFSRFATMPEAHLEKEYLVVTSCERDRAPPGEAVLQQLREGVDLGDGTARAAVAEVTSFDGRFARLRLVVTEGRFRLVRRMLRAVGYSCLQLLRMRIGEISGIVLRPEVLAEAAAEAWNEPTPRLQPAPLGDAFALQPGECAPLEAAEVQGVYRRGLNWLREQHPV